MATDPIDAVRLNRLTLGNAVVQTRLLTLFRQHGPANLTTLRAELTRGDISAASKTAHKMRGSALIIAAEPLAGLLESVEAALRAGTADVAAMNGDLVGTELQRVVDAIDRRLMKSPP